jgi:hypothetical protein
MTHTRLFKSVRFLFLFVISVVVTTASATVYYTLVMEPHVTVTGLSVQFASGEDTPAGSTVTDAWCRLLLRSYPNATQTYDRGLNISNTDSADHSIRLRHVDISPPSGDPDVPKFQRIAFILVAQNGTAVTTFEYSRSGNTWNLPPTSSYYVIPANEDWTVKIETISPAAAPSGIQADLEIALDVQ